MNNPRGRKFPAFWLACCLCSISFSTAFTADLPNKKEIITKARQSYYNLRTQGLASYRCDLTPNWDSLLAGTRKKDPASADKAVKTLSQIHFSMSLDADNKVQITHNQPPPAVNAEQASGFDQIFSGMQEMITGFFQTAEIYILGTPFPEVNSEYQLEDQGGHYLLSYKEGEAAVVVIMDKDLVMSSVTVTTSAYTSTIQPQFLKNSKGLLLTGYMAIYKSKSPGEDTQLNVQVVYQEVNGLQLPQKLNLSGSYGSNPFAVEVGFSGYQITRK